MHQRYVLNEITLTP